MFGLGKHNEDKTVVTIEQQNKNVVAQPSVATSSVASSSVANATSNVAAAVSNTVNKAVAGLTSSSTSNVPVVTKTSETVISSANAPVPSKEYTEFVQLPKVVENTQYQTQYQAQQVQEATIKLKQQPIQVIEQPTVIKTQPIITHKQVVEVEQERPIEMIKKTVGHETLPAIEKKEVIIQPVRAVDQGVQVITKQVVENGQTVTYEVRGEASNIKALDSLNVSNVRSEQGVIDQVKQSLGGVRQNAHDIRDVAPAPAVNALHSEKTVRARASSSSSSSSDEGTKERGVLGRMKDKLAGTIEGAREKASEALHRDTKTTTTEVKSTNFVAPSVQQTKVTVDAPAGSVVKQVWT